MTVTGVATAIGLTLIGVPFPVALGLLAFLTEAIPIAGPIIAGAVMVAVALLESPGQALATVVLVFAIQQLEGLVLVPQIQGRVISISPAVALLAVFAGGALGGVAGALVAIPVIAIATVVIDDIVIPWRHREIDTGDDGAAEAAAAPEEP
jgi:predicted PurR-regulated permease PerM